MEPINLLGMRLDPTNMVQVHDRIAGMLNEGEKGYLAVAAIHSVLECHRDVRVRSALNGSVLTAPDGMPLVWIAKFLRTGKVDRVYGADLLESVCTSPQFEGCRHFFLGGTPEVNDQLVGRLQQKIPTLDVVGNASPALSLDLQDQSSRAAIERINQAAPDVLWVALGTGKQERWIAANREWIEAPVIIGVGAAFDFLAGTKAQAPRWLQQLGFEWFFRLTQEPARLWRRYLEYPRFFWLLAQQALGIRTFEMDGLNQEEVA